ncbi:MAG: molecular chaperone TorD family protein [Gammaproteobacteria bacterium]|nr:molecular chaperone TorD family protein [Gammaproteobacteria bacterium]MDA7990622.1 molecular chaperone TorD family protein [Gammaproteobacteria bacterium]
MSEAASAAADRGRGPSAMNDERRLRADTYAVLAALLGSPPSRDLLDSLARIQMPRARGDGRDEISRAWQQLRGAAGADLGLLQNEYHDLFIGPGRGQVVPFGSWHLTGFLMRQPLSDLRGDLRALGITPCARRNDPEDHIAALCENMAQIIPAAGADDARERRFFARHLLPWAGKFFGELQAAKSARFYEPVGMLGRRFMELEREYLNIRTHIQTH